VVDRTPNAERTRALAYDNVSDVIFFVGIESDDDFRFLDVNEAFLRATGLRREQVVGQRVVDVIPETSRALVLSRYRTAIAERRAVQWEEVTPYPSGVKYGEVSVTPVFGDDGACAGLVGTVHDATDTKLLERQLSVAQQITHIGSWEWNLATNVVAWSDELYRIYGYEPRSQLVTFEFFLSRLVPEDRERVGREVSDALARGDRFSYIERIARPDGTIRVLDTVGEALKGSDGKVIGLIGTCRDVTEERERDDRLRRFADIQAAERRVLEMIASNTALEGVLEAIVRAIESFSPGTIASILLLDAEGTHLKHGAAPSLPDAFNERVDGAPIGPRGGSCGTAAFERTSVFVSDIQTDPRWEDYRDLARIANVRACWSTPLIGSDERVLGTFALYYREPREPSAADLELVARATHIAQIAIQRRQLDDALRALSGHIEAAREDERTGIAREIHDELGQGLTAVKLDLAWIGRRRKAGPIDTGELQLRIDAMTEMIDGLIHRVRRISSELRPGVLDDLGLHAAVEWQCREFEKRTGAVCLLDSQIAGTDIDRDLSTAFFRMLQEALTNVARHAQATRVDVRLTCSDDALRLEVVDDGRGIARQAINSPKSLGLLGIQERARRVGGVVRIESVEPHGTSVRVEAPLVRGTREVNR
jgi:PAS domain S-box-containing protein